MFPNGLESFNFNYLPPLVEKRIRFDRCQNIEVLKTSLIFSTFTSSNGDQLQISHFLTQTAIAFSCPKLFSFQPWAPPYFNYFVRYLTIQQSYKSLCARIYELLVQDTAFDYIFFNIGILAVLQIHICEFHFSLSFFFM